MLPRIGARDNHDENDAGQIQSVVAEYHIEKRFFLWIFFDEIICIQTRMWFSSEIPIRFWPMLIRENVDQIKEFTNYDRWNVIAERKLLIKHNINVFGLVDYWI